MCNLAFGWGRTGHQIINGNFGANLPPALHFITEKSSFYVAHASDADDRKSSDPGESPRHFIDIDYYPEFNEGLLSHDYDSLCAEYGKSTVSEKGTLPWAINSAYNMLVVYMENQDWNSADRTIADLGHYIGDACQPLHCTQNYDGAMTGNRWIHSRFESGLLDRYQGSVAMNGGLAERLDTSALEFAFRVISESNSKVGAIMNADTYAKGVDPSYGSDYYSAMWSRLDTLITDQLNAASEALSSLVYSAWLEAGSPSMTGVVSAAVPADYQISDLYPNPFNPVTNIDMHIPVGSRRPSAVLSVYSSDGRLVRREDISLAPGGNTLPLDFSRYASGLYFVVLNMKGPGIRHRYALKAVYLK